MSDCLLGYDCGNNPKVEEQADEITRLRAALKPFAKAGELFDADHYDEELRKSFGVYCPAKGAEWSITAQDLFNARQALQDTGDERD